MAEKSNVCVGKNGKVYDMGEIYRIVRELLQNENLPEDELVVFMRSEMFLEVCPDLYEAFNSSERRAACLQKANENKPGSSIQENNSSKEKHSKQDNNESKSKVKPNVVVTEKPTKIKKELKEFDIFEKSKPSRILSIDSDSDCETKKKPPPKNETVKKKRIRGISDSSSNSSSDNLPKTEQKISKIKVQDKKPVKTGTSELKCTEKVKETDSAPKVHPFWLGKMGATVQTKGKLFQTSEEQAEERERARELERNKKRRLEELERKRQLESSRNRKKMQIREPKPYSHYRRGHAQIDSSNNWKLKEEPEFNRMQKRHNLKALSVLCVDLLKLDTIFHHTSKGLLPTVNGTIPLKRHMNISEEKSNEILKMEKVKRISFKPLLNKIYSKSLKNQKNNDRRISKDISSDEQTERRYKKHNQRIRRDSSSDSSDPVVPKNRVHQTGKNNNARRQTMADRKNEQRKKRLDKLKSNVEQKNQLGTRKLPWEETGFFGRKNPGQGDKKENILTQKEKDKRKLEEKYKISKKNAPAVSFQTILQQITAANQEAAKKPFVELKIPKLSERANEYRKPVNIKPGDVAAEVAKLLQSNNKVEIPLMPTDTIDYAEYTIHKIAWWFLKSEKEPADEVLVHPELHDDEIREPWYVDDGDSDSDCSSMGCVSDPEGVAKAQIKHIPLKNLDPDVADEFCGLQSLEAKIRRPAAEPGPKREADTMKAFFKVRPGSNYEKPNFEAKCFLCEEKVIGQRQLGAHIRSESHKNHFRNYSLKIALYEEMTIPVTAKKVFTARLVEYAVENTTSVTTETVESKSRQKVNQDDQGIDSPMAVIDDVNDSPEMIQIKNLPLDQLSLPSIGKYDLEPDEYQKRAKITLRTAGKWTPEMELQWKQMQDKEARITEEYNDWREKCIGSPETHPLHGSEWLKFWEKRSLEVEAEGRDPEKHNYSSEWVPYWLKKMQEIMKLEVQSKITNMKKSLGLDSEYLGTLITRYGLKLDSAGTNDEIKTKNLKIDELSNAKPETLKISHKPERNNREFPNTRNDVQISNKPKIGEISKTKHAVAPIPVIPKKFPPDNKPAVNNHQRPSTTQANQEPKKTELDKNEQTTVKKPPVAPPPPKLSQINKNKEIDNHYSRKDSRDDKRHNDRDRDRRHGSGDFRNDSKRRDFSENSKNRRNYDHKDDRKREHTRSPIQKRRDEKHKITHEASNSHNKLSKESSSENDWEPKPPKISKDDVQSNNKVKPKIDLTMDILDVNAIEFTNLQQSSGNIKQEPDNLNEKTESEKKPKDLASALEELREAMEFAEPIIAALPVLTSDNVKEEKIPDIDNLLSSPPVNTSVVMDLETNFGMSPINTSVEMELCDTDTNVKDQNSDHESLYMSKPRVKTESEQVKIEKPKSSPEDGEIDSSSSSVSMGVDLNHVSSFMQGEIPGIENLSGFGSKKKRKSKKHRSSKKDSPKNVPLLPSPTKMDKNSIGYHLLMKPMKDQEHMENIPERTKDSPGNRFKDEVQNVEKLNLIGHFEKRRNSQNNFVEEKRSDKEKWKKYSNDDRRNGPHTSTAQLWKADKSSFRPSGPQCRKTLPPPPPPPNMKQGWLEESWETDDNPPARVAPPKDDVIEESWETDSPSVNVNSSSARVAPPPDDNWEDESWDTDDNPPAHSAPANVDLGENSWGPQRGFSKSSKTKTDDDAPYSPTWDEQDIDVSPPKPITETLPSIPKHKPNLSVTGKNQPDQSYVKLSKKQRRRLQKQTPLLPAPKYTGNYIPPLFSPNNAQVNSFANSNYQAFQGNSQNFPNQNWNNYTDFNFSNQNQDSSTYQSSLPPESYNPYQYHGNYWNNNNFPQ